MPDTLLFLLPSFCLPSLFWLPKEIFISSKDHLSRSLAQEVELVAVCPPSNRHLLFCHDDSIFHAVEAAPAAFTWQPK